MKKKHLEADTEQAFVWYAEIQGCEARKLRDEGEDGFPDRTVMTPYGTFYIEFKRGPDDELRPSQIVWKNRLEALGYIVLVTWELDEAKQLLDMFLKNGRQK